VEEERCGGKHGEMERCNEVATPKKVTRTPGDDKESWRKVKRTLM